MVESNNVPNSNAGRESTPTIWGWVTYIDLLVALIFCIIPGALFIFASGVTGVWLLIAAMIIVGWFCFLTYPFGGSKIYFMFWDLFVWLATKKIYTVKETKEQFSLFSDEQVGEEYIREAHIYRNGAKTKDKKKFYFFELTTYDISLCNKDEIDRILNKYHRLFSATDEINFSQVKIDWKYNFKSNNEYLENNIKEWKKQGVKDNDVLIQSTVANLAQLNQLEDSSVLQKKYFLVASGKNATVVNQAIAILKEELLQANLLIKEATKEAVDICLSKLIPTIGENKTIKFFTRYYIINQNDKETYYKTFLIRALPKQVGQFWNQGLFNLDEATINIQYYGVTSEKIKKRYADKLNQLVADRKAKTMVDKSAKMQELQAIQDLADEIGIGGAKLKKVKYMITIQANTLKELNKKYGEVKNMIAHNKMKVNSCWMKQWDAYCANIPSFNDSMSKEANMMLTDMTLALSYPYTYSDYIDKKGDYYGYMTDSGNPIMIDFAKVNREVNSWSTLVIGKSGGGKSTATKLMGISFIANPRYRKIFFIDPENEYTTMVRNYGGDVIDCSGQVDGGRINPFHIYMAGDEEGNGAGDRYMAWQQHFYFLNDFFMNLFNKELNQQEISTLQTIITTIYRKVNITPNTDFQKVEAKSFPTFTKLAEELNDMITGKTKSLYNKLTLEKLFAPISLYAKESKICPGNFASLWDGPTNIKMNGRVVSFNIQKLISSSVPANIKSAQMQLLLRFIEDLCIGNKRFNENLGILNDDEKCFHTATFCDEFHLLADKNFTKPIEWFYHFVKRIRKYKGKLIPITQSIKDLTASPDIIQYTSGIVNVCQFMFTFHLNAIDIDDLDKLFVAIGGLKSEEKVFLKGKTQGECIFGIGNETRIKMRFDYTDGLIKDMINKDMSEFKNKLKTMKGGE